VRTRAAREIAGADAEVDHVGATARRRLVGRVVDAGDDITVEATAAGIEDLDADQSRAGGDALKRLAAGTTTEVDAETCPADRDARDVRTVTVVILGIVVVVVEVTPRGRVDPVRVHQVIGINAGVAYGHANAGAVRRMTGRGELTLQPIDQRRAVVQAHEIRMVLVLFHTHDAGQAGEFRHPLSRHITQVDDIRQ
jgi:hypothetical protein